MNGPDQSTTARHAFPTFEHVAIIIPALNEAENLKLLLPELNAYAPGQIIVGDNGSTDGTGPIAANLGATVATEPKRGYGGACWAAMQQLDDHINVVVFLDADRSDDPKALPKLVTPILQNNADLVIGARVGSLQTPGAMTPQQRFGNRLFTRLIRLGWGHTYQDLGPFRAIRRTALDRINMQDRAFGWTIEMQIRAIEENLRIIEIPVPYAPRHPGTHEKSKISGTLRGTLLAAYYITTTTAKLWLRSHRFKTIQDRS